MSSAIDILVKQADTNLVKDLTKLMHRIERIYVPSNTVIYSSISEILGEFTKRVQKGFCLVDVKEFTKENIDKVLSKNSELILRKIDWNIFVGELKKAVNEGNEDYVFPPLVQEEIDTEIRIHEEKLRKAIAKEKIRQLQVRNNQPVMPGKWRKEPFVARSYERLDGYVVTNTVGEDEAKEILNLLHTPLDGYLGQAYNYDDHGLTEEWMINFQDRQTTKPSDHDVIRTQLVSLLEIMIVQVQDRVCTEEKVLQRQPLVLGVDVKEVPVWGIDCYTRRMIELAVEDRISPKPSPLVIKQFIERLILPTINEQPVNQAHNLRSSLLSILQGKSISDRDRAMTEAVLAAVDEYGMDNFKIHPKGTGVVCMRPEGIPAHVLVSEYLGELYPPYRWCEKLDVVEQAQKRFELKPTLPDFYNILLERPRHDPEGYGLLYVDASQKANIGSSCSHSCESNCTSAVVARNGKLTIALTTNRFIHYGEELTMDYYSITTSDVEWRAAICLCGTSTCRGSFLHYATQDELQQVLNQNYGPLWRYSSLLRACSDKPVSDEDRAVLQRHGIQKAAFGCDPPKWVLKYAAEILRFIEYERKALPCALIRKSEDPTSQYSYSNADMDARTVMEQRIQSMICCISMVTRIVSSLNQQKLQNLRPLSGHLQSNAISEVYARMKPIPALLTQYLLKPLDSKSDEKKSTASATSTKPVVSNAEKKVKIEAVISAVKEIVAEVPTGMAKLRELCLGIRKALLEIEEFSTAIARINQLNDILVLWAYTMHFSFAQEYEKIVAEPITVVARELGTCIPRSKIFSAFHKEENNRRRSRSSKSADELSNIATRSVEDDQCPDTTTESIDAPSPIAVDPSEGLEEDFHLESTEKVSVSESEVEDAMMIEESSKPVTEQEANNVSSSEITQESIKTAVSTVISQPTGGKGDYFLSPNEPVFMGSMEYPPLFCFWQLIGWFNAGTDQKIGPPDLFGCAQLPDPMACFGPSESNYGEKQRETLLSILKDEKLQTMPWPQSLKSSFSISKENQHKPLYGSPMLDTTLGQVDAVLKVLRELKYHGNMKSFHSTNTTNSIKKGNHKSKKNEHDDNTQFDNILPPELPTSWVQCELCKKWRRVGWYIDADTLPDLWECSMNTWDLDNANCNAPQDSYDPQKENTFDMKSTLNRNSLEECIIGTWRDVYCNKNHVYYEAQIKKLRKPKKEIEKVKILFHYKGWSSKFDEWIEYDSERIQAHHLFTNPAASNPREQEAWQGIAPVQAVIRSAISIHSNPKKRKSSGGAEGDDIEVKKQAI